MGTLKTVFPYNNLNLYLYSNPNLGLEHTSSSNTKPHCCLPETGRPNPWANYLWALGIAPNGYAIHVCVLDTLVRRHGQHGLSRGGAASVLWGRP